MWVFGSVWFCALCSLLPKRFQYSEHYSHLTHQLTLIIGFCNHKTALFIPNNNVSQSSITHWTFQIHIQIQCWCYGHTNLVFFSLPKCSKNKRIKIYILLQVNCSSVKVTKMINLKTSFNLSANKQTIHNAHNDNDNFKIVSLHLSLFCFHSHSHTSKNK